MLYKFGFSVLNCYGLSFITECSRNLRPIYLPATLPSQPEYIYTFVPGMKGAYCVKSRNNYKNIGQWDYSISDLKEGLEERIILVNNKGIGNPIGKYYPNYTEGTYYDYELNRKCISVIGRIEHLHATAMGIIYKDLFDTDHQS